jgi:tripartite-type tricarboxylate transporter receptor subunit TctC
VIGLVATGPAHAAHAQAFDACGIVHLVVPFPAGGSADVVARLLAKPMSQALSQTVIVDNKPGADGVIAAEAVSHAPADGCTLFFATYGALSAVPHLHKGVKFDPLKDFTPISRVGTFSMLLYAHPSLGVRSVKELEAYRRTHREAMHYATGNVASIVLGAALNQSKHLDMVAVPYKGEVPAMNDFLAGRVQLMFATPTNALPFVKEGKLVALAVMSDQHLSLSPEVPTWREAGLSDMSATPWAGILGPAGMAPAAVARVHAAVNQALRDHTLQPEFQQQGFESMGSTPGEFKDFVKGQLEAWRIAVKDSGLREP